MSFRINNNVTAMTAYRNLSSTGLEVSRSITRLSTGLRINSGADDPAGLIASENFRSQISGMSAALRNNQDALNYAKTADGALDEVSKLLRDARALAVANGNSSVDATQKAANQTQLNNILTSIDRVASTTAFGSRKLLNGGAGVTGTVTDATNFSSASLTGTFAGAAVNSNGMLSVNITTAADQAVVTGTQTYSAATATVTAGTFSINGKAFTVQAGQTVQNVLDMVNAQQTDTGVRASWAASAGVSFTAAAYGSDTTVTVTTGTAGTLFTAAGTVSDAGANAVAAVTYTYGTNTVSATFNQGRGLQLKDTDGNTINVTATGNTATNRTGVVQVLAGSSSFQIGSAGDQTAQLSLQNFSAGSLGLSSLDITGSNQTAALSALDAAVATVSSARGNIGSFMRNTIESNMRSLSITRESLVATESSIRDVDVAEEMTNYTKLQILQQAGLSVLAQANSAPQSVLSLLR